MGRGRGKGKKSTVASHEDPGSGGEEPLPAYKRRGRPQKPLKDDLDDEEVEKIEEGEADNPKPTNLNKEKKVPVVEYGNKRKRNLQGKDNTDSVKEENGASTRSNTENVKSNGFRPNGSRRKNTPRRAAEAGVDCNLYAWELHRRAAPVPQTQSCSFIGDGQGFCRCLWLHMINVFYFSDHAPRSKKQ